MNSAAVRILLLTDADVFAGTERHVLELATALNGSGCDVVVGCPDKGVLAVRAREANLRVFPVEKRGRIDLRAAARLWMALRRKQFDVIHTHNGRTALLATIASSLAGRGRIINTQHFLTPAHTQLRGIKAMVSHALHRWIAKRAYQTIAISEAVRRSIAERQASPGDKVCVVLNGVSDPQLSSLAPRAAVRAAFGIPDDAPLVITSARLEREKGVETLIEAMSDVALQMPSCRCLVAGEGLAREWLQADLERRGLSQVVTLVGFQTDIHSLMAAADVFVLPSAFEPFGLALIEAMAVARPVIASRAGGPLEIIADGISGLLFSPGDAGDLASAIVQTLTHPDLAASLAVAARRVYLERFTARRMADELLPFYQENIRQSAPALDQVTV